MNQKFFVTTWVGWKLFSKYSLWGIMYCWRRLAFDVPVCDIVCKYFGLVFVTIVERILLSFVAQIQARRWSLCWFSLTSWMRLNLTCCSSIKNACALWMKNSSFHLISERVIIADSKFLRNKLSLHTFAWNRIFFNISACRILFNHIAGPISRYFIFSCVANWFRLLIRLFH